MGLQDILRIGQEALLLTLLVCAPAVLGALVVGLVVGFLQAATQVQDQTLAVVPKILVVFGALAVAGAWSLAQLSQFATTLLESIAQVAR